MIIEKLRNHLPSISAPGAPTYLDSAATAHMPREVSDAITQFYMHPHGSVHRGVYAAAERATSEYEAVREQVAAFIGAGEAREIIFTAGATDSLNAIAHAWALHTITAEHNIVITQADHHASVVLWREVAKRTGAQLRVLPVNPKTYTIDCSQLDTIIDKQTALVCVPLVSNVLGPIWGKHEHLLAQVTLVARAAGAAVALDCAQAVAHQPLDLAQRDCDFAVFSAHKMGGPTGLGVLYVNKRRHEQLRPYRYGGGMVRSTTGETSFLGMPQLLEAGTPPLAQVAGLGALLSFYTDHIDWQIVRIHESMLCFDLIGGLKQIKGVHIIGNPEYLEKEGHCVSFMVEDMHAHDVAHALGMAGVCVRAGDHCAQPLNEVWDGGATVRASFMYYNNHADVAALLQALRKALAAWRG